MTLSAATSVVNTDMCSVEQETTWGAGESRTMQRLMLGSTDITLSLTRLKVTETSASAVHSAWEEKLLSTAKDSTSNQSKHPSKSGTGM